MLRRIAAMSVGGMLAILVCGGANAQQAPASEARPRVTAASLVFKVEWVRPASQTDTKIRYIPVQDNIGDPKVEMKYYGGGAIQILTTGAPGSDLTPYGIWSGTAETPFAITFKSKDNYVDLTGLSSIRWFTKTSGFHVVRPVVKLANGTLLVGDAAFSSIPKLMVNEFAPMDVRWIRLDPDRIVTLNSGPNPVSEIWVPNPDLSKVDEIGFADLLPGSGHGTGGWIQLGNIEVFGKAVPRTAVTSSR